MRLRALRYTLLLSILFGISFLLRASLPSVATGTWVAAGNMSAARSGACTVALNDGRLLISGGADANGPTATADLFSTTGSWSAAASMNSPRSHQSCAVLQDGRVLVAGGTTSGGGITNSAEIYDPSADSWAQAGLMNDARSGATASVLQDGRVLIAGGQNSGGASNTLEIFDPNSGNFSNAGTLSSPRQDHAAAVLSDGRVLIVGGSSDGTNALNTTDIYDPQAGSVSAGPAMSTPRAKATAITLLDGTVVVIGGSDGTNDLASAEFFDPAANNFNAAGSLTTARSKHSAFLLPNNNEVLVVGGQSAGTDLASAELYIPWQKAFQPTGAMATPRSDASGAALTKVDGRVLIAGGSSASAELYGFATVKTDAADYPPGTTVNITGSGWQPGETVTLTLVESPLIDTHGPYSVVADAFGNISNSSFVTDAHDENIRFYLTAAGSQSQAQNTFTDSKPNTVTLSPATATVLAGSTATYSVTVNFNGNGNSCTSPLSLAYTGSTPVGATATFNPSSLTSTGGNANSTLTITTKNTGPMSGRTQPGTYPFTVTAGSGSGCQAGTATVNGTLAVAGSATGLSVTGYPSPTTAGTSQSFTVTALDANGNTALGYTGTVHFTSSDAQAALPANYTFVAADNGTHTFAATLKMVGTQAITAADTVTGTITGSQNGITVNAAATANLLVAGYPSPVTAGTSNSFSVTAQDTFGNLTAGYTGTVHFTSSDGAATLPANYTFTTGNGKDNGTHTFSATINTAGTQSITATDTVTASINGTQSGITVNASTVATSLALAAPSPTSVPFGSTGLVTFSATLTRTTGGAVVSGATVNFTVDGNAAGSATTNSSGVATISNYNPSALSVAGHNVQASFAGATISGSTYTASTSGTQTLTVTARVTSTSISPLTASTAAGTAATFTITVTDTDSGTKSNPAGTVAVTSTSSPSNTDSISACALTHGANPLGTVSCQINVTPTTPFAVHTINASFTATDSAHANSSTTTGAALTVSNPDTKPPVVSITFSAVDGQNGWYVHSPVLGTVSANDTTTGNSNVTAISCTDGVNTLAVGSPTGIGTPTASGSLSISGESTHNISCQATDSAGNSGASTGSTAMPVVVKIDTVAPTGVAAAASRAADHNGWYTSAVTITFSGTDTISGIASCTSTNYSGPDSATASVTGHCTDNAGNSSADATFNFKYDGTAPTAVALSVTAGTVGANGWYTSDVTVHTSGTETVSTPLSCTADQFQTAETAGQVFNGSCTNDAGMTTNATALTIKLDKTAPTADLVVTAGTAGTNGWYTSDVTVHASGNDTISNPVTCTSDQVISTETTGTPVNGSCTNNAGLSTNASALTVKLDKTAPLVTLAVTAGTAGTNGWYTSDVTVHTSGTETISNPISCVADQFQTSETTGAAFNGSCTNDAGLTGHAAPLTVKLDKTGPSATLAVFAGTLGDNGWYVSDVTVRASGTDSISTPVSCTADQFLTTDSAGHVFSGSCTNDAGLSTNATDLTVKLDKTPPTVNITPDRGADHNGWYNHALTFTNLSTDATSGIASCTTPAAYSGPDSGSASVSASCKDNAGNTGNGSFSFMYDATPPTSVGGAPNRVPDHNGWYNHTVDVVFTGNDVTSGIDSCSTLNYSGPDTATASVMGSCTDKAGNSSTQVASSSFKFDSTPPTAALAVTAGTPGANGWYTSNVTVSTSGTDTVSNPTVCTADQFQTAETTGAAFNGECTNDAGLSTNAAPLTVKLDKTAPTNVTLAVTAGTLGHNSWYVSNVTIHTSGDENISTPIVCTLDQFQTTDTAGQLFHGSCTNDAGLSANASDITVKRDATPPVVHITPSRAADHNGWYNHSLSFTNPGTDATSGIASCTAPAAYSGPDTATASVSASCEDEAGNTANDSFGFMYDATPPTNVAGAPNRVPDHNGWYNHAVDVVYSGNDPTSGIEACSTINYAAPDTTTASVMGHCTDVAGNSSADVASSSFKFDATPPNLTGNRTPGPNGYGWNNVDVTATFSCSDSTSGVEVGPVTPQVVSAEGADQSRSASCADVAGNSSNFTVNHISIDKTNPTIVLTITPGSPAVTGWYNMATGKPTVTFTCGDSLSGVASCTPPVLVGEGANQTIAGNAMDKAGNSASTSIMHVNVDVTAPTVNLINPGISGSYLLNQSANASYSCSDAGSSGLVAGSAGCGGPVASGSQFDTASVGSKNFTVNAKDVAGNTASQTNTYGVFYSTGPCLGDLGHTVLQPINATGTMSVFKVGSTVPTKFRVCDANGVSIGTPGVVTGYGLLAAASSPSITVDEDTYSTTPDTAFRWDPTGQQWIFNQSTKNNTSLNHTGTIYYFGIHLNDDSWIYFQYGLR